MRAVGSRLRIEGPPALVWPYIGDLEGWSAWIGDHLRPRLVNGPMGVGATYTYNFVLGGRIPVRARGIVVSYQPGRLITVRNRVGPIELQERFELAAAGPDATDLAYSIRWGIRPRILELPLWPLGWLSRRSTRRMVEYELALVRDAVTRNALARDPA